MVGFHPDNRDGQPPSGLRCESLCAEVLHVGFDADEANASGVVVCALPGASNKIEEFNIRVRLGDEKLANVKPGTISYGSLSHSHLHVILQNISASVVANVPGITGLDGRLSLDMLKERDSAFAEAVESGLKWEVLEAAMEQEEPDACIVIQAALNCRNSIALVNHEMQCLASMSRMISSTLDRGEVASFSHVREALQKSMPELVKDDHILDAFRFVVDMGSDKEAYLMDLLRFHEKFVDAKLRKLNMKFFQLLNTLPGDVPWVKIALAKLAYRKDPNEYGYCDGLSSAIIKEALSEAEFRDIIVQLQKDLAWFRKHCKSATMAAIPATQVTKFFGNLDTDLVAMAFGVKPNMFLKTAKARSDALTQGCAKHVSRLEALLNQTVDDHPWKAVAFAHASSGSSSADSSSAHQAALQPSLIRYHDGKPINQHEEVLQTNGVAVHEKFNWSKFLTTQHESAMGEWIKAELYAAISRASQVHGVSSQEVVGIYKGGSLGKEVRVVAERDIPVNGVVICPLVRSVMQFVRHSQNPWTLTASYAADGVPQQEFHFVVSPSVPKLLSSLEESASDSCRSDHQWLSSHLMHPFWCMRKVENVTKANCTIQQCQVRVMRTTVVQIPESGPAVGTADIQFPVIVPCTAIRCNEELCVYWVPRTIDKPCASKRKTETWHHQEQRKLAEEKRKKAQHAQSLFET